MRNIDINFEKAMKNKDYINIMNKASAKFISQLDRIVCMLVKLTLCGKL